MPRIFSVFVLKVLNDSCVQLVMNCELNEDGLSVAFVRYFDNFDYFIYLFIF